MSVLPIWSPWHAHYQSPDDKGRLQSCNAQNVGRRRKRRSACWRATSTVLQYIDEGINRDGKWHTPGMDFLGYQGNLEDEVGDEGFNTWRRNVHACKDLCGRFCIRDIAKLLEHTSQAEGRGPCEVEANTGFPPWLSLPRSHACHGFDFHPHARPPLSWHCSVIFLHCNSRRLTWKHTMLNCFNFMWDIGSSGGTAQSVLLNASLMLYRLQQVTLLIHQQPKVDVVITGNAWAFNFVGWMSWRRSRTRR